MSQALQLQPSTGEPDPVSAGTDLAGLRRIYEEHGPWLRAALARLGGPGLDTDDLLHEVFLVAIRRYAVLTDVPEPRAWLYGVAVHVTQAARRRARVRRWFGLERAESVTDGVTPEHAVHASDARRRVYEALEPLSEKKRTVFVLFELEGLSGEEVAAIVGCPLKTVWTRLHHARKEFQQHLRRRGDAP